MVYRWPLHPLPKPYESLSSWLRRIAQKYEITVDYLLKFNLAGIRLSNSELDNNPSEELLFHLAEKTGLAFEDIRSMTFKGYVPLLIDSLLPLADLFENYVCQFHTLSPANKRKLLSFPNSWIPWVLKDENTSLRGCPLCVQKDQIPYIRLYWQLSWISSCSVHGIMLEQIYPFSLSGKEFLHKNNRIAPDEIKFIDQITQKCLTQDNALLPNRITVNAAIWLRKLRSLLDELSQPLRVSGASGEIINTIYRRITKSSGGRGFLWRPFEALPTILRITLFQMAGVIVQDMLSGMPYSQWRIKKEPLDLEFLYSKPIRKEDYHSYYPKYSNKSGKDNPSLIFLNTFLNQGKDKIEQDTFWERACHDKDLAFFIRQTLIKRMSSYKVIQAVDENLKRIGIPIIYALNS